MGLFNRDKDKDKGKKKDKKKDKGKDKKKRQAEEKREAEEQGDQRQDDEMELNVGGRKMPFGDIMDIANKVMGKQFFGTNLSTSMEVFQLCSQRIKQGHLKSFDDKEKHLDEAIRLMEELKAAKEADSTEIEGVEVVSVRRDPARAKRLAADIINNIIEYFVYLKTLETEECEKTGGN